ncbi:MAG: sugar transferase [Planctomycetes bacterium]|nr:sugar transferase [Planctomycetota bacterium]
MSDGPALSAIIVNYHTRDYLRDCLRSIARETAGLDAEIIVIDNNSPDDSAGMVAREFPKVTLLANALNVGFSRGVNQGLKIARGRAVLVLNADVVARPGSIRALLACLAAHPEAGVVAARLLNPDGTLQLSCRTFYTFSIILWRRTPLSRLWPAPGFLRRHLMSDWDHAQDREVDWALGACLLVRREALAAVGGMDERYFLYLEDVDWCLRMRRAGWKVIYCAGAEMVHHHLQASRRGGFSRDYFTHFFSMLRFYDKWSRRLFALRKWSSAALGAALAAADGLAIAGALRLAYAAREALRDAGERSPIAAWIADPRLPVYRSLLGAPEAVIIASVALFFFARRLYDLDRERTAAGVAIDMARALLAAGVTAMAALAPRGDFHLHSRFVALAAAGMAVPAMFLVRWAYVGLLRWLGRRRIGMRRVLMVGVGPAAREIAGRLGDFPGEGYDVAGYLTTDGETVPPGDPAILGRIEDLPEVAERERAQEVIFTDLAACFERAVRPMIWCRDNLRDMKVVLPDYPSMTLYRGEEFFGYPVLRFDRQPGLSLARAVKAGFEAIVALALLAAVAPGMLLCAVALRATGERAFVSSPAVGRRGARFRVLAFDTGDPAAPARGLLRRFLRATRFQHLPELLNVLAGSMSLIGPRPVAPAQAEVMPDWQRARFEARPGVTGLWQARRPAHRRLDDMARLDLYYVQNWSLALDLRIAAQSAGALLRRWFGRG